MSTITTRDGTARIVPNAQLKISPGASHGFAQIPTQAPFNDDLLDFITGQPAERQPAAAASPGRP